MFAISRVNLPSIRQLVSDATSEELEAAVEFHKAHGTAAGASKAAAAELLAKRILSARENGETAPPGPRLRLAPSPATNGLRAALDRAKRLLELAAEDLRQVGDENTADPAFDSFRTIVHVGARTLATTTTAISAARDEIRSIERRKR